MENNWPMPGNRSPFKIDPFHVKKIEPFTVEIIPSDGNGDPETVYELRGQKYVESVDDVSVSIRIKNNTGLRLLAVVSVDSRSIVTGELASLQDTGFIVPPMGSIVLSKWMVDGLRNSSFTYIPHGTGMYKPCQLWPRKVLVDTHETGFGVAVFEEYAQYSEPRPARLGRRIVAKEKVPGTREVEFVREAKPLGVVSIRYGTKEHLHGLGIKVQPRKVKVAGFNPFPATK